MNDKVYSKVNGKGSNALNQNLLILERILRVAGVKNDAALARLLNIQPQNIASWKKTGIPDKWIVKISKDFGCSVNFLLHGDAEPEETKEENGAIRADNAVVGKEAKIGLGEAVDLLAQIIQAGKEPVIQALYCTLSALSDAVESANSLENLSRLNQDLRQENAQLRDRLDSSKIEQLEQRIENIEKLYQEQLSKKTNERREIMHKLGTILGFNNSDSEKTSQQITKR